MLRVAGAAAVAAGQDLAAAKQAVNHQFSCPGNGLVQHRQCRLFGGDAVSKLPGDALLHIHDFKLY